MVMSFSQNVSCGITSGAIGWKASFGAENPEEVEARLEAVGGGFEGKEELA